MAVGDVTVFEEAKAYIIDGDWSSTDNIWVALIDNTGSPAVSDGPAPKLGDYTQHAVAGTYAAGGLILGTLATCVTEAGGVMTFDSPAADPTWAQDAANDTAMYWGLVYNTDSAGTVDPAIALVELGGPVDMTAGALTIAWHTSGLFTIT